MATFKRVMKALASVNLADVDAEIAELERELARLRKLRSLIAGEQTQPTGSGQHVNGAAAGTAADPTPRPTTGHQPLRERIIAELRDRTKPMRLSELAKAVKAEPSSVCSVLASRPETFKKHPEGAGWSLK